MNVYKVYIRAVETRGWEELELAGLIVTGVGRRSLRLR